MGYKFQRFSDYQDTGLPWVGQCPAHWSIRRMKYLMEERIEKGYADEQLLTASQNRGVIPKADYGSRTVEAQKDLHLLKLVEPGDYVISLRSFQGGIEYAHVRGIISPAYTVLQPKPGTRRGYYEHFFKSAAFINSMSLFVTGIREGQNIDYVRLSRAYMPVPPPDEQDAIGRFIRHLDHRVNRLIKTKRRLIELLNEQKQAIIHRAVTRGLDPTVPLKPSGIDWLGDIPAHWEAKPLKRTCQVQGGFAFPASAFGEAGLPVVRMNNLKRGKLDLATVVRIPAEFVNERFALQEGDLLYGLSGSVGATGSLGNFAFVGKEDLPAYLNQRVARLMATHDKLAPSFLVILIQTPSFYEQVLSNTTGTAQFNVSPLDLANVQVALPPVKEQFEIADNVASATAELNEVIEKTLAEIDLIREYRSRLVADVVTGQLDVRHLDLPDVDAQLEALVDDTALEDELDETEDLLEEVEV
jgi:type I restriction enzyme S subunit